jgi:2-isopropylmalate synthase
MIMRASKLVSAVSAFPVQYNKAIVGKNAFAHESGIHQDGMLKNAETYEIMRPEDVGVGQSSLVMGKHSGRHAFREKLTSLGYSLGDNAFEDAFRRFKDLADKKKHVFDEDIEALVEDEVAAAGELIKVVALTVIAGTGGPQRATITLDVEGRHETRESTGDGPVDATFNAIKKIVEHSGRLTLFQVGAVTEGTDAQAEVSVRLEEGGKIVTGRGADTDTMVASAKAYVSALNKLITRRAKSAPEALRAG